MQRSHTISQKKGIIGPDLEAGNDDRMGSEEKMPEPFTDEGRALFEKEAKAEARAVILVKLTDKFKKAAEAEDVTGVRRL